MSDNSCNAVMIVPATMFARRFARKFRTRDSRTIEIGISTRTSHDHDGDARNRQEGVGRANRPPGRDDRFSLLSTLYRSLGSCGPFVMTSALRELRVEHRHPATTATVGAHEGSRLGRAGAHDDRVGVHHWLVTLQSFVLSPRDPYVLNDTRISRLPFR